MTKPTRYDRDALAITWYVIGAVLACIAISALSGCKTVRSAVDEYRDWRDEQKAKQEQPAKPETPPAQPETPATPEQPSVPQGDNTFLWKPVSESRQGRCAVITPANLNVSKVHLNGINDTAEYAGRANGERQHFFQRKTGAAYGRNVSVEAIDASGAVLRKWTVPDGAARWGSN